MQIDRQVDRERERERWEERERKGGAESHLGVGYPLLEPVVDAKTGEDPRGFELHSTVLGVKEISKNLTAERKKQRIEGEREGIRTSS